VRSRGVDLGGILQTGPKLLSVPAIGAWGAIIVVYLGVATSLIPLSDGGDLSADSLQERNGFRFDNEKAGMGKAGTGRLAFPVIMPQTAMNTSRMLPWRLVLVKRRSHRTRPLGARGQNWRSMLEQFFFRRTLNFLCLWLVFVCLVNSACCTAKAAGNAKAETIEKMFSITGP